MSAPAPGTGPSSGRAGRPRVTALIPAFNEEENLPECLASVSWCDEVLVVDSFSKDRTVQIAKDAGARVLEHEYLNSAAQKNWSIPQASCEWILVVDADERVSPELGREIRGVLEAGPSENAFSISRVNHFLGRKMRHGGWESDRVIRLFRKDRARYQEREVHSEIETEGRIPNLDAPLVHYTFRSFRQYMPKVHRYTDWGARQAWRDGQRSGAAQILLRPAGRFLKMYFLRLGFLDGAHGIVLCLLAAFSVYLKYAKLWELGMREGRTRDG